MQILFSWKNDKNISKCLLKTLPRMLSVMVCRNKSRVGLCTVKPITCTKRRISLHTLSLHISSLIRAFANAPPTIYGFNKTCDERRLGSMSAYITSRYYKPYLSGSPRDRPSKERQLGKKKLFETDYSSS